MTRWRLLAVPGLIAVAAPVNAQPTEANLLAADAEQMRIIVEEDAEAQMTFMHPNYIINSPANLVQRKDQVVARLERGELASDSFERTIEGTAITDDVGIVMGREAVRPSRGSQLDKLHPGKLLHRRFTNVFLWREGTWSFIARHATIVTP